MIVLFNRKRTRWRPLQLHYLRFWSRPIEPSDPPSHRLRIIIISITVWPRGIGGIKTENSCKSESSYRKIRNAKEAEVEWFCDDLQDLLELTPKKRCSSHYRGPEWKSRKSRERKKIGENSRLFRFDLNQMSKKKCEKKKSKKVKEKRKDIPIWMQSFKG